MQFALITFFQAKLSTLISITICEHVKLVSFQFLLESIVILSISFSHILKYQMVNSIGIVKKDKLYDFS